MNTSLGVCLAGLGLAGSAIWGQAARIETPQLRPGIHVQMAVTGNAVAMPDADRTEALVVAVTENGSVYLGIRQVSPAALTEQVKSVLASDAERKIYLKADARTGYRSVLQVMAAVRAAGARRLALLTTQRLPAEPRRPVPPTGLEVLLDPGSRPGNETLALDLLNSGQREPIVTIDGRRTPWADLATALEQRLRARGKGAVLVKAEGTLTFVDVAEVADACRGAGGQTILVVP